MIIVLGLIPMPQFWPQNDASFTWNSVGSKKPNHLPFPAGNKTQDKRGLGVRVSRLHCT